jgi:hypothetical protein
VAAPPVGVAGVSPSSQAGRAVRALVASRALRRALRWALG